ncbi:MAG: type II toxin-antitoxin system HipA family toxin [Fimbriimonas sp.]
MDLLEVRRKDVPVGHIERTPTGGRFRYHEDWLASIELRDRGIAARMPPRAHPYEVDRIPSLPPFFINLLPEGSLLRRLSKRDRIAQDDLVSHLALLGEDTVGDVWTSGISRPPYRLDADVPFREAYRRLLEDPTLPPPSTAIAGVQPKMSADRITLPYGLATPGAFLKLTEDERFVRAAENEAFFMRMAADCGLRTARTELVHDSKGESALLVHRFDRRKIGRRVERLHQEDACQLLDLYPADKYHVSVEEVGEAIRREVVAWPPAALELILQFAFGYLIGNHDQHAKNVSVLEVAPEQWSLSPVYDMVCTLVYGDHFLALKLNGTDEELQRADFLALADTFAVRRAAAEKALDRMRAQALPWLDRLAEIGFHSTLTQRLEGALRERHAALGE